MSEVLRLPESECERALGMLSEFVDGALAAEQSAWLGGHLEGCVECRAAMARFAEIDRELTAWGLRVGSQNAPPQDAREQLEARLKSLRVWRWPSRWALVAGSVAAAVAVVLALAVIAPHRKPPAVIRGQAVFVEIPYLPPLDPHENAAIVRMNIRVATLIAAGYKVAADPDTIVPADVLVGEDGRAHAIRVLSGIDWSSTGD